MDANISYSHSTEASFWKPGRPGEAGVFVSRGGGILAARAHGDVGEMWLGLSCCPGRLGYLAGDRAVDPGLPDGYVRLWESWEEIVGDSSLAAAAAGGGGDTGDMLAAGGSGRIPPRLVLC
jgi:hypothetical protein